MKFKIINYTLAVSLLFTSFLITTPVFAEEAQKPAPVKSIWSVFNSPEGDFRILMPGEPKKTKEKVKTKTGEVEVNLFSVERKKEGTKYSVAYIDYPPEYIELLKSKNLIEKAIDTGKNTALKTAKGSVIDEKRIDLDGHPGKEVNYTKPGGLIIKHRVFLVGNRLYQVSAEVSKAKHKFLTKSISGFCDSFTLLGKPNK